jgi:DNA-binding CsgD family transcriptional regulator
MGGVSKYPIRSGPVNLTPRQKEVARMMLSRRFGRIQIAETLGISRDTAENHLRAIRARAGAWTTPEAAIRILNSPSLLEEIFGL